MASLLIPMLLFVAASWLNYREAFSNAERDLVRISEVAREHAAKVFDGQSHVIDRVTGSVRGMDAAAVTHSEQSLHEAFAEFIANLPQVEGVLLADRTGHPLVIARIYPAPRDVNLKDRDFFKAVTDGWNNKNGSCSKDSLRKEYPTESACQSAGGSWTTTSS